MSINKHLDRLRRMHQFIKFKRTGTPEAFAEKMGLSTSLLYRLIAEMKALGAPVHFCFHRQSYVYYEPVELQLGFISINPGTRRTDSDTAVGATIRSIDTATHAA